jgi:hypothetical protein
MLNNKCGCRQYAHNDKGYYQLSGIQDDCWAQASHQSGLLPGWVVLSRVSMKNGSITPVLYAFLWVIPLFSISSSTLQPSASGGSMIAEFIPADPGNNGLSLVDGTATIRNTFVEGYWNLAPANGFTMTGTDNYNLRLLGTGFTSFTSWGRNKNINQV